MVTGRDAFQHMSVENEAMTCPSTCVELRKISPFLRRHLQQHALDTHLAPAQGPVGNRQEGVRGWAERFLTIHTDPCLSAGSSGDVL
jgi:hypothetical protein